MFEKEAKEWADEMYPCDGQAQRYLLMGAEFGYNKCFEQIRKIVNEHTRLDCIIPELLRLQENE